MTLANDKHSNALVQCVSYEVKEVTNMALIDLKIVTTFKYWLNYQSLVGSANKTLQIFNER